MTRRGSKERAMFDPKTFSFDVEKMTELFKQNDFTKHLAALRVPGVDAEALLSAQQKNMDALVEANKAAAAGYQDLFKKQMAIFEETMAEAQKQMKQMSGMLGLPGRRKATKSPKNKRKGTKGGGGGRRSLLAWRRRR